MSDQRHDIASSDDAIKWWKQSSSNDENQNGKNIPKLNRKVPLTPGAAIALSIICIVLMLPGAELRMPSQIEKSHSMMLSLNTSLLDESTEQDPPCSGYFVFVVDDSSNTDFDSPMIVESIANITHNWKIDEKLQLTVAITANGSTTANNFTKDLTDWTKMLDDSIDMMGSLDPPTTPIHYANIAGFQLLALKAQESELLSDEAEIDKALNEQNPWLKCALAGSESVFMVAVDGAPDLFMQLKDLDQNAVQELNKKISNTMCDCTKLSDGSSSPGCLPPSPPPTTPTPIVTSTSSDKPTTALTNPSSTSSSGSTPAPNTSTSPGNDHSTSRPSSYGIRNTLALPVHYVVIVTLVIMNAMSY